MFAEAGLPLLHIPVAKGYVPDEKTTEEGLKKWLNNQHSDGLFPEVPIPTSTGELPAGVCAVTGHKLTARARTLPAMVYSKTTR